MSGGTLKSKALKASAGEIMGVAGSHVLRFVSTLILSRLLFPEAFGLAALVGIFNTGLVMLSDVGLLQSVLQDERGDDRRFLDTVWTLQVIRGVTLWWLASLLAWPMAAIYGEPALQLMIPVGATSVLLLGFASTSLMTLRRRLNVIRLVRIELAGQTVGLAAVVAWALVSPSAWAIVAGGLAGALYRLVASHLIDVGYRNWFAWDHEARRRITDLGKWVYGSSSLTFVGRQSDRLLLGHYMGMATLGIYSIAVTLGEALGAAVERITRGVLLPLLSRVHRDEPEKLGEVYYKARLRLDLLGLVPLGVLAAMAQTVVEVLYDPRYIEAGWMLQALCLRVAMNMVLTPVEVCLFSIGRVRYSLYRNVGRCVWILIGVPIVWPAWGLVGVVWVTATSEIPGLFVLWRPFIGVGLLRPAREALAVGWFVAGMALGVGADLGIRAAMQAWGMAF